MDFVKEAAVNSVTELIVVSTSIVLISLLVYFCKNYYYLQEKFHVLLYLHPLGAKYYHDGLREKKRAFFKPLQSHQSLDAGCRSRGELRILEIGAGHGANFEFYPANTVLSVVEVNSQFREEFEKNLKDYPGVRLGKFTIGMAEDMSDIPDHSIDIVVSTMVLCSVRSIEQTLKEIQRVLIPGGKYYYWEHVHAEKGTWLHLLQELLSHKFNVFSYSFAFYDFLFGCYLNRKTHLIISNDSSGFANVKQECFYHHLNGFWYINKYTVAGVATSK